MYKIGEKSSFGLTIYCSSELNMVSDWTDCVFLNKRKDGKFTIRALKWAENFRSPSRYVWIPISSQTGIRPQADAFLSAISLVENSILSSIEMSDVEKVLFMLDEKFADEISNRFN